MAKKLTPTGSIDERLRAAGYEIVSRPKVGEPIWGRRTAKGALRTYPQSVALKRIGCP